MVADLDDEDPWDFLPKTRPAPIAGGSLPARRPAATFDALGFGEDDPPNSVAAADPDGLPSVAQVGGPATPASSGSTPAAQGSGTPTRSPRGRRFAGDVSLLPLRQRARPMALALAVASLAGYLTEVVGNAQLLSILGPNSMTLLYPLSGLGLLAVAALQFRDLDAMARLRLLRLANLGFALLIAVALVFVVVGFGRGIAIGVIWLCADQLSFMIPLLIWAGASDEFNVAEGRKIFGWMITWTYLGQLLGLVIGTFSPPAMDALGVPLYWLLLVDPIVCLFLGLWLPRALSGSAVSQGSGARESLGSAISGAFEFTSGIPAWRALVWASLLVFVAGMSVHLTYTMGVGMVVGDDAAQLQVLFGAMNLGALVVCWLISRLASERILERLGIPGVLLILPIATVFAGIAIATGSWRDSLLALIAGITIWRIPRLSVDESARRAALTLVPDQRRARVSFLITLGPMAVGLVASGFIAGIGLLLGQFWIAPVLAALLALAGIPFAVATIRHWDDSLLSWRIRRRKVMRHI